MSLAQVTLESFPLQLEDRNLTKQEVKVISYLVYGYSAKRTGLCMGLSHRTIEMHLDHIKSKLGVKSKYAILPSLMGFSAPPCQNDST